MKVLIKCDVDENGLTSNGVFAEYYVEIDGVKTAPRFKRWNDAVDYAVLSAGVDGEPVIGFPFITANLENMLS